MLPISSLILALSYKNDWSTKFKAYETASDPRLLPTVATAEYFIIGCCSIAAILLYIYAGVRYAQGDGIGALLSFCGATVIAFSPYINI